MLCDTDLKLQDSDPEQSYIPSTRLDVLGRKWGQLKLLEAELRFLLEFARGGPKNVVYAGAAPGNHIPFLVDLFPECTFHLYDPRDFGVRLCQHKEELKSKGKDRIFIYQQLFETADAAKWSQAENVLFISDIRSESFSTASETLQNQLEQKGIGFNQLNSEHRTECNNIVEAGVESDMIMQMHWTQMICPLAAHLKFRLPYCYSETDRASTFEYLDGEIWMQVFTGAKSTETRLVCTRVFDPATGTYSYPTKTYSPFKYESQLFHHNLHRRVEARFVCEAELSNFDLYDDYDSAVMIRTLARVLQHRGTPVDRLSLAAQYCKIEKVLGSTLRIQQRAVEDKRAENEKLRKRCQRALAEGRTGVDKSLWQRNRYHPKPAPAPTAEPAPAPTAEPAPAPTAEQNKRKVYVPPHLR